MQTRCACCGSVWLFLILSHAHAQSVLPTLDDRIVAPAAPVKEPVGITLTQVTFNSIARNAATTESLLLSDLVNERMRRLEVVSQHCALTDAQLDKLELAIRIDSARLKFSYDEFQGRYVDKVISPEACSIAMSEVFQQLTLPLQRPCGEQSLFRKVLRRQASPEQWACFQRVVQAEKTALVESHLTGVLAGPHRLTEAQLHVVISHLLSQYPDWEPLPQRVEHARFVSLLALDEQLDQLEGILTAEQRELVQKNTAKARLREPTLRRVHLWPLRTE